MDLTLPIVVADCQSFPILMCYGEYLPWFGVDHSIHDDTGNKLIFKHAKYINETNTKEKEGYLIPYV